MLIIFYIFLLAWIVSSTFMVREAWDFMDLPVMCSRKRVVAEDDTVPRFGGTPNQGQVWDLNGMNCPKIFH